MGNEKPLRGNLACSSEAQHVKVQSVHHFHKPADMHLGAAFCCGCGSWVWIKRRQAALSAADKSLFTCC